MAVIERASERARAGDGDGTGQWCVVSGWNSVWNDSGWIITRGNEFSVKLNTLDACKHFRDPYYDSISATKAATRGNEPEAITLTHWQPIWRHWHREIITFQSVDKWQHEGLEDSRSSHASVKATYCIP